MVGDSEVCGVAGQLLVGCVGYAQLVVTVPDMVEVSRGAGVPPQSQ